jgi:hypothetical protein
LTISAPGETIHLCPARKVFMKRLLIVLGCLAARVVLYCAQDREFA